MKIKIRIDIACVKSAATRKTLNIIFADEQLGGGGGGSERELRLDCVIASSGSVVGGGLRILKCDVAPKVDDDDTEEGVTRKG